MIIIVINIGLLISFFGLWVRDLHGGDANVEKLTNLGGRFESSICVSALISRRESLAIDKSWLKAT